MQVYGITISEEVLSALVSRMKNGSSFKAIDLEAEATRPGVPHRRKNREAVAMRVADRLIQRERKANNIRFDRPDWVWIGQK